VARGARGLVAAGKYRKGADRLRQRKKEKACHHPPK
jgi:hypothetical protein